MRTLDRLNNLLMTLSARLFGYSATSRRDVDVVFIPARREIVGVPETILRFSGVLSDESRRCVTIVAHGD